MEPIDPAVFEGRDPAWREWWEERLDQRSRTRVEDAVKTGRRPDDPDLEPFVYGLISRKRRRLRWRVLQLLILLPLSAWWAYFNPIPFFKVIFFAALIVGLTFVPWKLRRESRQLSRVEQTLGSTRGGEVAPVALAWRDTAVQAFPPPAR